MAKQTFTTGQVLTAAQMTSLQQTAMGGGSATAKTASYVLVAADAGTSVLMNSASSTTITVNTALFAAGDTVYIQNLGAGVSTITAGTATVNTSASLALAQYEGGQLYFNSTSDAIFIKGAGAAAASGGMTLLSTTTLTGASVTLSSISQSYKQLYLVFKNYLPATSGSYLTLNINSDTGTRYYAGDVYGQGAGTYTFNRTFFYMTSGAHNTVTQMTGFATFYDYTNTTTWKMATVSTFNNDATTSTSLRQNLMTEVFNQTGAITSLTLQPSSGNFTSGTILLYGVN